MWIVGCTLGEQLRGAGKIVLKHNGIVHEAETGHWTTSIARKYLSEIRHCHYYGDILYSY